MALTDLNKDLPARRPLLRLPARVQAWLSSEHSAAQRMAGTAFIIRVASAAVVFLSQIILARWMGSFEYGTYVYVWTWVLLAGDVLHLGLPLTAQRNIPEYTQQAAFGHLRGYLVGSRWIVFGMGTLVGAAGAVIVRMFEDSLDQHVIMPFYLACVALPFYSFSFILDGIARSYNWMSLALLPHSLLRPVFLLVLMAGIHAAGFPMDATTAMIAVVISTWLPTLGQLIVLNGKLASAVPAGDRQYDVKGWLTTSLPVVAVWGLYTFLTCTDVLVLRLFRSPEEVAHYYAASKTLTLVTFVYFAVTAAAAHRFTAFHVAGDREGLAKFVASAQRMIFWPSVGATLLILALGKPMLWLFGPAFVDAYPVMFVLAVGLLARASIGPAERLLTMLGQQRICALAYAAAFAVNVAGCFLLAGRYGGMGVAIGTAMAYVVESTLLFLIVKRRLGLHLFVWQPRAR